MPQPALVSFLADYGFYEVFLPFILVFAIVYGILSKTQILGRGKKNIEIMVSLALALIAIGSLQFSEILKEFIPKLGFGIVIVLGLALFLGLFGVPLSNWITVSIGIFVFLIIILLQFSNDAINRGIVSFLTNGITIAFIIVILIIYLIVRSPKKKEKSAEGAEEKKQEEKPKEIPGVPKGHLEELARLKKDSEELKELREKEGSKVKELLEKLKQK